jgi:type II secretory pathway pseudopilin PulG
MTTAIAATVAFPKFAIRIASTRIAKFATAFVLAALLMLNGYFYVAANTINNDLVAAGIVQAPTSTSLVDRLEMSVLGNNVASVAISAGAGRGSRATVAGSPGRSAGSPRSERPVNRPSVRKGHRFADGPFIVTLGVVTA